MALKPVIYQGKPLFINNKPAFAEDPCVCCGTDGTDEPEETYLFNCEDVQNFFDQLDDEIDWLVSGSGGSYNDNPDDATDCDCVSCNDDVLAILNTLQPPQFTVAGATRGANCFTFLGGVSNRWLGGTLDSAGCTNPTSTISTGASVGERCDEFGTQIILTFCASKNCGPLGNSACVAWCLEFELPVAVSAIVTTHSYPTYDSTSSFARCIDGPSTLTITPVPK